MGTVCSQGVRVSSLDQCVLRVKNFMVRHLLVEVECFGFQCVLEDSRVLGYQIVFKASGCPRDVRIYLLGLCKKQSDVGARVS